VGMPTNPPPMTNEPGRRTRVGRGMVKYLIIAFFSTMLVIVFVRALSHSHETAAERQQREALAAEARKPPASPDALRSQLEAQQVRARAEMGNRASTPAAASTIATDDHPLPAGYNTPQQAAGLSDADRLALQRQADDDQSRGLSAWEDAGGRAGANAAGGNGDSAIEDQQQALRQQLANQRGGGDAVAQLAAMPPGMQRVSVATANAQRAVDWQNGAGNDPQDAPLVPTAYQSPYIVEGGTPINAVILHAANSDMPGTWRAMVDRDIYDSANMNCKLIPKGTKLVGLSNNDVAIGQERMQLAATKMFFPKSDAFPNGASMKLDGLGAADPDGEAGISAGVNNHFWKIFGSTFLIAGVAELIGRNENTNSGTNININGGSTNDLRAAAGQSAAQTTQTILQRNANIQPTLTLKPGQPMVFMVKRDLLIPPQFLSGDCQ
jgi:type IV secretion system protein TrbI